MAMMISKFHKLVSSKRVWTVFAVLISVAFVIAYSGGKYGQHTRHKQQIEGKLFGKEVSRKEFSQAMNYAHIMLIMQTGKPFRINEKTEPIVRQTAWQRLAILHKAHQMGLTVDKNEIVAAIQQEPIFQNRKTKMFDRDALNYFLGRILPQLDVYINEAGFEKMVKENVLINKASRMAAQGALVTDTEINRAFHFYSDKLTVDYATIPHSLASAPKVTAEDAKNYYNSNTNQFVCPEKVMVKYVAYPLSDYTNEVTVTDDMVTNYYDHYKSRFVKSGTEQNAQPEYKPLSEVKDYIVNDITTALARRKADTDAGAFVSKLSRGDSITFDQLAKQTGKTVKSTSPFAIDEDIKGIDPTAKFAQTAFTLELKKDNPNHYYSDPVVGKNCIYVIDIEKRFPSFLPGYDAIAKQVMEAAQKAAADKAYIEKAQSIHTDIAAALKAGTAFKAAADKAGLKVKTTKTFSVSDPLSDDIGRKIMQATAWFDTGTLVDLIPDNDNFLIAYVAKKVPADKSKADPDLIAEIKSSVQRDKASRLASAWQQSVLKEAQVEDYLAKKAEDHS